jgi:hypothetical protein
LAINELTLIDLIEGSNKKDFYSQHVFHERQMNSCPIGCEGCAVSAVNNAKGSIKHADLLALYEDAKNHNVSLQITKVEGYDPAFVNYSDAPDVSFAANLKAAVDLGHQIITPVCTTGNWRSDRTKWQMEELGKLENKYRYYQYPSGNSGYGYALSVPREIRPFKNGKYEFEQHLEKILEDVSLLTANGDIDVLIYYNSKTPDDYDQAIKIKSNLAASLTSRARERANLIVTDFNCETLPESCYRYKNSLLISDKGFTMINPETMEWDGDPNMSTQEEIAAKFIAAK